MRASSWARTTTWRALSVKRSNIVRILLLGDYRPYCGAGRSRASFGRFAIRDNPPSPVAEPGGQSSNGLTLEFPLPIGENPDLTTCRDTPGAFAQDRRAKHHVVAVLEPALAPEALEQTSLAPRLGAGDRAGPEQITRRHRRATRCGVGEQLRGGPVEMSCVRPGEDLAVDDDFELDVERLAPRPGEVREWRGILWPRRCLGQVVPGNDPGRDRGRERLAEERPQR